MKCSLVPVVIVLVALVSPGTEAQTARAISPLRVGAAKVEVTPSQNELSKNGYGAGVVSSPPGGILSHEIQPKLTFTGSGSTSTPRIKYGSFKVYGEFVDG